MHIMYKEYIVNIYTYVAVYSYTQEKHVNESGIEVET